MAVVKVVLTRLERDAVILTWGPMLNGDTGEPCAYPSHSDKSLQVTGTFGTGGSVAVQGSNDGVTFPALNDFTGTVIAMTAAGIKGVGENTLYVRPAVTAGDGTTSLTVTMLLKHL